METGVRLYKVYGPDYIAKHIENIDLPRATASEYSQDFQRHVDFLRLEFPKGHLLPERYSIIAADNPNCNPGRLRCIDLTGDLDDYSSYIADKVYENEAIKRIKGRLHWFYCDTPSREFFLQMIGPMALAEIHR